MAAKHDPEPPEAITNAAGGAEYNPAHAEWRNRQAEREIPSGKILDAWGFGEVQSQMLEHESVRRIFEDLDLGWTFEDVADLLDVMREPLGIPDDKFGQFVGAVITFAAVCVHEERHRIAEAL